MAFVIADRVRETSTTTGTGNFTLAGAVTGYQTFDAVLDTSDTTYYTIADQSGANFEVGIGTFTSPATLARTTILSSSNGGSVVTFGAGTKDVFISLPASKTVQSFSAGSTGLTPSTASFGAVALAGTLVPANGGTGTATAFTAGSVVFAGASGVYAQDNTNLFFDDTNNRLGIGTSSPSTALTIATTSFGMDIQRYSATSAALPAVEFKKSKSGTVGVNTTVSNGDGLGRVTFSGADGTNFVQAAQISAEVDGTPGTNDMPGRLVFSTTADGASTTTERMRIDNAGNVGIGTSSPLRVLHVVSNAAETQLLLRESDSSGPQLLMGADSAVSGSIINASSVSGSNNNLLLQTGGTERARIDSNGNVQINTTNAAATGTTCRFTIQDGTTYLPFGINNNAAGTGASNVALFARNGTTTGTISVTGTTTAYNTSSDYRLKHDVQPMLSGLSTIAALKPSTYKWNADNSPGEGFIAHELQAVIPQAVTGEKDAVNDDGSIKSQGVDYSKIVVHLVAAIQELKAEIDLLKGKP